MRRAAALLPLLLSAACVAGSGGLGGLGGNGGRDWTSRLPPRAEPTSVIAVEIAFARAAREDGQWTAFSEYSAPDAVMAMPQAVPARDWLRGRANPSQADRWAARQVWASCDGSAVVVAGIALDPDGAWSRFTRVWERQRNDKFRWIYTSSTPDPELTRAQRESEDERSRDSATGDEAILVEAGRFIRARVADCAAAPTPPSQAEAAGQAGYQLGRSDDGTLLWRWPTAAEGSSGFMASFWTGSEWEIVPSDPAPALAE